MIIMLTRSGVAGCYSERERGNQGASGGEGPAGDGEGAGVGGEDGQNVGGGEVTE